MRPIAHALLRHIKERLLSGPRLFADLKLLSSFDILLKSALEENSSSNIGFLFQCSPKIISPHKKKKIRVEGTAS